MGLWDWMFGGAPNLPSDYREGGWHRAPPPDPEKRKDILKYPNRDDVEFAKKYDAFYGTPADAYVNGTASVNVLPSYLYKHYYEDPNSQPSFDGSHEKMVPSSSVPHIQEQIAAAALAANRSPVAGVGFDPRVMHWENDPETDWNIRGFTPAYYSGPNAYSFWEDAKEAPKKGPKPKPPLPKYENPPKKSEPSAPSKVPLEELKKRILKRSESNWRDRVFIDAHAVTRRDAINSTPTHESVHRGIGKLEADQRDLFNRVGVKYSPVVSNDANEYVTRREMYQRFGNPEGLDADYPDQYQRNPQIDEANGPMARYYDTLREHLDRLAQEKMKLMRPMGPR